MAAPALRTPAAKKSSARKPAAKTAAERVAPASVAKSAGPVDSDASDRDVEDGAPIRSGSAAAAETHTRAPRARTSTAGRTGTSGRTGQSSSRVGTTARAAGARAAGARASDSARARVTGTDAAAEPITRVVKPAPEKLPAEKKPAEKKPAEKEPVAKGPAAKKPVERKPADKKSAAPKEAAKKGAAAETSAENAPAAQTSAQPTPDAESALELLLGADVDPAPASQTARVPLTETLRRQEPEPEPERAQEQEPVLVLQPVLAPVLESPPTHELPSQPFIPPTAPDAATAPVVLSIRDLHKRFGSNGAVDGISRDVRQGSCYGIVGPHGAGKTTTLAIVTGLLRPDAGRVEVHEIDVWKNPVKAKRTMGVLPDHLRLFDRLTGAQLLFYCGTLRGLDPTTVRQRSADLAVAFGLEDALGRLVADYSAGMTKKVALACAMIHSPRLLVLDEPFESVDPVSAANVIEILQRYVAGGGTVVLSSHGMDLIQRVCDSVAIIVGGVVLDAGTVDQVRGDKSLEDRFVELAGGRKAAEGMEWLHSFSD
jgi:ABC-type multidrug transport system ATPase subunit